MKKIVNFKLSEELHYQLKLKATKEKITIQELLEKFVKDYVEKDQKKV